MVRPVSTSIKRDPRAKLALTASAFPFHPPQNRKSAAGPEADIPIEGVIRVRSEICGGGFGP